jgi:hypothetical protein
MKGSNASALADEVAQFHEDLHRMALQIVEIIFQREREARQLELAEQAQQQARGARRKPAPGAPAPVAKGKAPRQSRRQTDRQLALGLAAAAAPAPVEPTPVPMPAPAPAPVQVPAPAPQPAFEPDARLGGKRRKWTREAIVDALAHWLVNGNALDASYVTRHGPPGLAAAARRIFGRFDAALNVAGLHVSKLYPDGPPPKNASARAAAAASAAQNQST